MNHQARCSCEQLKLTYQGDIKRMSMCHCFECQKRTGSAFGIQTRLERNKVTIEGQSTEHVRMGDEGGKIKLHFCPSCGSTVFWYIDVEGFKDSIVVAAGAFEDQTLPAPTFSVYEARKHHWVDLPNSNTEHMD